MLFLDEPTTGLDPQSRLAAWDVLKGLHGAGQAILLTTHAMDEAERLCDRIAIMDHGTLLALGTPAALKAAHGGAARVRVVVRGMPPRSPPCSASGWQRSSRGPRQPCRRTGRSPSPSASPTILDPRHIQLAATALILPVTFFGAVYYPWELLSAIPWLKYATW